MYAHGRKGWNEGKESKKIETLQQAPISQPIGSSTTTQAQYTTVTYNPHRMKFLTPISLRAAAHKASKDGPTIFDVIRPAEGEEEIIFMSFSL